MMSGFHSLSLAMPSNGALQWGIHLSRPHPLEGTHPLTRSRNGNFQMIHPKFSRLRCYRLPRPPGN